MKITPSIALKKVHVKRYWRSTRLLFAKIRHTIIEKAENTDPANLRNIIDIILQPEAMQKHIDTLWSKVGGLYYYDTERKLKAGKSANPDMETKADKVKLSAAEQRMFLYSNARSLQKTKQIMTTYEESINKVIDMVLKEQAENGLGVLETRKLLTHDLRGEEMLAMENWQAQRIAMTEIGSAQNTGSFEAAKENSSGVKKEWMFIPGLKTFRENHKEFEAMGAMEMSHEYSPGLKFPGDPDCNDPSQIISCYCSITYTTEN